VEQRATSPWLGAESGIGGRARTNGEPRALNGARFEGIDLESEDSFQQLKSKSLSGIGSLFYRQLATKIIYLVANIVLARMLAPQIFGVFAIVSFVVQFFSVFGDVGIGAALIQKKGDLDRDELSTIFWLQQFLVWGVALAAVVAAPLALKVYPTLPPVGVWLIRVMAAGLVLASLKTVPAILLERNIEFNRIAIIDVAESLSFHGAAIAFALAGYEVWSFVWAALIRSLLGVLVVYSISPWRPDFRFRFGAVRGLLGFGLPYQGNNILAFIKDALTPIFLGSYAGAAAVGYVNWARNLAFAPLMLSEIFGKIAFPSFSRIQENRELLSRTVERSIRMMTLILFPVSALMVALGPQMIRVIYTEKWLPAIGAYYFYCTSPLVIGFMLPMYSALLALGKSMVVLRMTVLLLFLEWGIGILCVTLTDFNGIAFSQPVISGIFFVIYYRNLAREGVFLDVWCNISGQLGAAAVTGLLAGMSARQFSPTILSLVLHGAFGLLVYGVCLTLFRRPLLLEFREYLEKIVRKDSVTP